MKRLKNLDMQKDNPLVSKGMNQGRIPCHHPAQALALSQPENTGAAIFTVSQNFPWAPLGGGIASGPTL